MPPRGPNRKARRAEAARVARLISKIDIPALPDNIETSEFSTVNNAEAVASYSWLDMPKSKPTIAVPGSPRVWSGRSLPFSIPPDKRADCHRPHTRLEPLVASVQYMQPDFPFRDIDIVCDRSLLRKLLRWIRGEERNKVVDFRFDIQLAGNTMLCTHHILKDWLTKSGHGHNFERAVTIEPVDASLLPAQFIEYDRIIQYDFGGLRLLVRYEVDACMPPDHSPHSEPEHRPTTATTAEPSTAQSAPGQPAVKVIPCGTFVDQARIVELKSRTENKKHGLFWKETHPQLLLSQTPLLAIGFHESGTFSRLETHTLAELESRRDSRGWMYRLGMALHTIYELVAAQEDGALLRIDCVGGVLKLSGKDNRETQAQALPESMLKLFKPLPGAPSREVAG